jgi:hypothetical protein
VYIKHRVLKKIGVFLELNRCHRNKEKDEQKKSEIRIVEITPKSSKWSRLG